jgi:hypothetical protein
VYESLKASGELPPATLQYFDAEGAEYLLYELRFLAVEKRVEPAMYIVANNLDVKVCLGAPGKSIPRWLEVACT